LCPRAVWLQDTGRRLLALAARASHGPDLEGFRSGLKQLGHVEGQTIVIEERYADGNMEHLDAMLAELEREAVLLVVPGLSAALAVRRQAPDMPVVAVGLPSTVIYPDLFASLHRPGGSVTGFSSFGEDLAVKRVELLREVVPTLTTVAILHNAVDPLYRAWGEKTEDEARRQGLRTVKLSLATSSKPELAALMETARAAGAQGLIIVRDFLTHVLHDEITRAANDAHMATIFEQGFFVEAGGLISYGASFPDLFRRAAAYVDAILKGARPADLPIQLSTTFELVINLKTAKALGITIPPSILLRADRLVE
jgi:putative ABC transport system substrate-binding protein